MKIIDSIWYSHQYTLIGVVKSQNIEGEIKYFIGIGVGSSESEKAMRIILYGAKFDPIAGEILLPNV
ncbi:hypothetical protein LCGC14_2403840 [marine sediment metagenome]|uniref:Uncharacterized protein n=1 Tax=marine sediment metagenome TaxID=412755 RepID=A0A0F9BUQ4_9ZZZZ